MVPQSSSEFCTALDILFKKPRTGYRSEKVVSALKGSITIRRAKSEDDEEARKEDPDYASRVQGYSFGHGQAFEKRKFFCVGMNVYSSFNKSFSTTRHVALAD